MVISCYSSNCMIKFRRFVLYISSRHNFKISLYGLRDSKDFVVKLSLNVEMATLCIKLK